MARLFAEGALAGLGLPLTLGGATLSAAGFGPAAGVAPFRGREAAVAAVLPLPEPGRVAAWNGAAVLWAGEGRWLLLGAPAPEGLDGLAAVTDQTDAQACVRVEGPSARACLSRLVPLDLRDAAFPQGGAARTLLNHVSVTLLRVGRDAYEVMAPRSMAETLVHELEGAMRGVAAREAMSEPGGG